MPHLSLRLRRIILTGMPTPIEEPDVTQPPRKPPSLLFRLLIPVTFLFVFSCFAILTHDLYGDQNGRFAALLRDHGTRILGYEAAGAVVLAVVAMAVDRMRTKREQANTEQPESNSSSDHGSSS